MSVGIFSATGLSGRTVFITGGAAGIGAAIVRAMCAAGAKVIFADIDAEKARKVTEETAAEFLHIDLMDLDAIAQGLSKCAHVDILVNNAGVDQHAFFTKSRSSDWRDLLRINLEAVFATTLAVLPWMQENNFGRIINISSEAARQGSKGGSVYAAAKGGVLSFTKSIARENARFGITANSICPGPVLTPLLETALVNHGGDKLEAAMKDATLMGRLGTPEEVASLVVYLASNEAGFITGETIGVSGGMGC
ncbi:MAG: 3-oxoacyl-ACP reductase [Robiginitomaculum sp.]|nr:MAG: 3-oxoacyl-ACP reductase [Robiginitomaculum sp.]